MKRHLAAFVVLPAICAVAAFVGVQFAMSRHSGSLRDAARVVDAWEPTPFAANNASEFDDEPSAIVRLDADAGTVRLSDFPSMRSLFPPSIVPDSLGELPGRILITSNNSDSAVESDSAIESPAAKSTQPAESGPSLWSGNTPDQLPRVDDAAPIDEAQKRREEQTRAIIAQELPSASQEERDVWFDELKGLEPPMTRELLRLRKIIRHDAPTEMAEMPQVPPLPGVAIVDPPSDFSADLVSRPNIGSGSLQSAIPAIESSIASLRIARDVVLNNLANAHTTAFRRSRILFEDLAYQQIKFPGQQDANGKVSAVGVAVGFGVQVAGTSIDLSPGQLEKTGGKLHLAIVGDGFFQIQDGSQVLYSRSGAFTKNADGELVLSSADRGRLVEPSIAIPNDTTDVVISSQGIVSVQQAGSSAATQVGQIQMARFVNSDGLVPRGENLFAQSDASGPPLLGMPGQMGLGTLKQGYLETSNVNLEEELAEARRLQLRLQALEQVRGILVQDATSPTSAPTPRIAESNSRTP